MPLSFIKGNIVTFKEVTGVVYHILQCHSDIAGGVFGAHYMFRYGTLKKQCLVL